MKTFWGFEFKLFRTPREGVQNFCTASPSGANLYFNPKKGNLFYNLDHYNLPNRLPRCKIIPYI